MDIRIQINCPDLVSAANILAGAWGRKTQQAAPVLPQPTVQAPAAPQPIKEPKTAPAAPQAIKEPKTAPAAPQATPITPPTAQAPAPAPAAAPTTAPVAGPTYTIQDLAVAGANLVRENPAVHPQLMGLLGQFGVQAVTDLKPEQLGPFANAMRQMGAKL